MKEKTLELERLVFFSDAIVAIAATLLVFGLKIDNAVKEHLTFADLGKAWPMFSSFFLSFFIIAVFWQIHHRFFQHIRAIDARLLWYNILWLLFIVLIPFTSSLISMHFHNTPAMFAYCLNVFFITIFQNQIWDHVAVRPELMKETDPKLVQYYRFACNVAMINSMIAIGLSFFSPVTAFLILFARLPIILFTRGIYKRLQSK